MCQVPGSKKFGMRDGRALAHTMKRTFLMASESPFVTFGWSFDISAIRYPLPATSLFHFGKRSKQRLKGDESIYTSVISTTKSYCLHIELIVRDATSSYAGGSTELLVLYVTFIYSQPSKLRRHISIYLLVISLVLRKYSSSSASLLPSPTFTNLNFAELRSSLTAQEQPPHSFQPKISLVGRQNPSAPFLHSSSLSVSFFPPLLRSSCFAPR